MKISTKLLALILFYIPFLKADDESSFLISFGLFNEQLKSFSFNGAAAYGDGDVAASIEYKFNKDWGIIFSRSNLTSCSFFCSDFEISDDLSFVTRNNYDAELFHLGGFRNYQISTDFDFLVYSGLLIARESIVTTRCEDFSNNSFGQGWTCNFDGPVERESTKQTETGAFVGLGIRYRFSESWSVTGATKYGTIQDGYSQTGLSIDFRF